ncbi:MAG: SWIM zinc finger family protein [Lachnospiraceae bacterium]|nr:SWIM zinc finger family protein [Lachnospiraceae bacterium]
MRRLLSLVFLVTGETEAFGGGLIFAVGFLLWDALYKPMDKTQTKIQYASKSKWNYVDSIKSKPQLDRLMRAREGELTARKVDRISGKAVFVGSTGGDYKTTLNKCTCPDFQKRNMPCKHMYYLADACGLLDEVKNV